MGSRTSHQETMQKSTPQRAARPSQGEAYPPNQRVQAPAKRKPKKNPNLDKSFETGDALIEAAKAGDSSKLGRMLSSGADPDAFGSGGKGGGKSSWYAAEGGHAKACDALIQSLCDVNIPANGATAMQAAFQKGHKDILQKLFGATFNTLDDAVTQSGSQVLGPLPGDDELGYAPDDELPPGAADELKSATKKLANSGKAGKAKEAESAGDDLRLPGANEATLAREAAVKAATREISGKEAAH